MKQKQIKIDEDIANHIDNLVGDVFKSRSEVLRALFRGYALGISKEEEMKL